MLRKPHIAASLILAAPLLLGAAPANDEVRVEITNMRNEKGVVLACLTDNPKNFPDCRAEGGSQRLEVPAKGLRQIVFKGVKPGRYAIALLHDENNNGKADRALSLIPKEGFGFSRDAKVRMGPPKFKSAAFDFGAEGKNLTIKMRYML